MSLLLGDRFERLLNHRIALRFHFVALLHAERLIEDLGLQPVGDEFLRADPIVNAGLNVARRSQAWN